MANLGTLTLDLIAKIGGFTGPLDQAGRQAKKTTGEMQTDFAAIGTAAAGAAAAAAAGLAALTASTIQSAGEISRFAQISNTGVEEFQRYAAGARALGVEQEDLGNIFKDVQDKVGDFLATGGGEMADFFEKIAPQVGVTAEQFRKLSGPQALELYASSLEKAGVSQSEMIFYMESLADDASLLFPLLKNNSEGFKLFGDAAAQAGAILSADTIRAAQEFSATLDLAGLTLDGMSNQITSAMLPVLSDLASEFFNASQDGMDLTGVADAITAALKGASAIAVGATGAFQLLGKSLGGVAAMVAAIPDGFDAIAETRKAVQEDLEATAKSTGESINRILNAGEAGGTNETVKRLVDIRSEQEKIAATSKALTAEQVEGAKKAKDAAASAAKAIASQIAALELQAKTVGKTTAEVTLYKLAQEGATQAQQAEAQAALDTVAAYEKQQEALERRAELARQVAEVEEAGWSDASRALYSYQQQVETLQAGVLAGVISEEQRDRIVAGLDEQAAAAEKSADQMTVFMDEAARNIQGAFADFLFDPFSEGLDGMAIGFAKVVQRMAAEAAAAQLANQLFGVADAGGSRSGGLLQSGLSAISGLFANADGNAFAAGNVIPFAKGGSFTNSIVDQPTLFPFAQGTGLMGEAGPEAIMPLTRTADGSLGVRAMGGGGSTPIVINAPVTVQAQPGMSSREAASQGAQMGQAMTAEIRKNISNELRPGGQIWRAINGR